MEERGERRRGGKEKRGRLRCGILVDCSPSRLGSCEVIPEKNQAGIVQSKKEKQRKRRVKTNNKKETKEEEGEGSI